MNRRHRYRGHRPDHGPLRLLRLVRLIVAAVVALTATVMLIALGDDDDDRDDDRDDGRRAPRVVVTAPVVPTDLDAVFRATREEPTTYEEPRS